MNSGVRCYLQVRSGSSDLDFELISLTTGLAPSRTWRSGDPRSTGTAVRYADSWMLDAVGDELDLESFVSDLRKRLGDHLDDFAALCRTRQWPVSISFAVELGES